jgi:hypothetical protein
VPVLANPHLSEREVARRAPERAPLADLCSAVSPSIPPGEWLRNYQHKALGKDFRFLPVRKMFRRMSSFTPSRSRDNDQTTEPDFLYPVVVNDEETALRNHGTPPMRRSAMDRSQTLSPLKIFSRTNMIILARIGRFWMKVDR